MTNLTIRIVDTPGLPGGKGVLLCDEEGAILPQQKSATIHQTVGEAGEVVVTFWIDGKDVRFLP